MKMVGMPTSAYSAGVLRKIGWKGEPGRRYKRRPDGQIPRSIPQGGFALRRHYARTTAVVDLKHAARTLVSPPLITLREAMERN